MGVQTARQIAKQITGQAARCWPQARYGRMILILSHMRAASTALAHVLASHPQISGYGETHVPHDGTGAPGRVLVNLARRGAFDPRAPYLLDKLLHNRLDTGPTPGFQTARAIVLLRAPGPTVASLQRLAARTGVAEGTNAATAAQYYLDRVTRLTAHWARLPADRRLGLTTATLLNTPEVALRQISDVLDLTPQLSNRYSAHPAAATGGGGDPLRSPGLTAIAPTQDPDIPLTGVPPDLAARCLAAHDQLAGMFAAHADPTHR